MGQDPKTSVVNRYLQSWDVSNVFVIGACAYPQNASWNPTGTLGALTYWAIDATEEQVSEESRPAGAGMTGARQAAAGPLAHWAGRRADGRGQSPRCLPSRPPPQQLRPAQPAVSGAQGEGMAAAHVPRRAGQAADYLLKHLDDYADGRRAYPIMTNCAKALSPQQRMRFAARYASMSAPYLAQTHGARRGELGVHHQLAYQGDETKRAPACNGCHGPDGIGVAQAAPYLAGQSADYLAAALRAFRQRTRKNDAGQLMRSVVERLDDADIAAVAGYFAGLSTVLNHEHPDPAR